MTPTTCTITLSTGRCGRPAVTTFVGILTGETYAECEAHAVYPRRPMSPVRIVRRDIVLGKHRDGTPRTKRSYLAVDAHTGEPVYGSSFRNVIVRHMAEAGRRVVR
jgi:hypothetical protein